MGFLLCACAAFRRLHQGRSQRRDLLRPRRVSGTFPCSSLEDRVHRTCQKVSADALPERSESMERRSRKQTEQPGDVFRALFPRKSLWLRARTKTWEMTSKQAPRSLAKPLQSNGARHRQPYNLTGLFGLHLGSFPAVSIAETQGEARLARRRLEF